MRKLQFKFPNQIRISGWDFGSSARAMNQAGGKDSLMTYEVDENELYAQADLEKVSRSTTERKSMSTKTSIKRIALVAVSALGLGVLTSVAPANAGDGRVASAITIGSASSFKTGVNNIIPITVTYPSTNASGDTTTVTVQVTAAPTSGGIANAASSLGYAASGANGTDGDGDRLYFAADSIGTKLSGGSLEDVNGTPNADVADGKGTAGLLEATGLTDDGASANPVMAAAISVASGAAGVTTKTVYLVVKPDLAGSYSILVASNATGRTYYSAGDTTATATFATTGTVASATISAKNTSPVGANPFGVVLEINLKDAAGSATNLGSLETLRLTSTDSNDTFAYCSDADCTGTVTNGTLTNAMFLNGQGFFKVSNGGTASTVSTITLTNSGTLANTINTTVAATFKALADLGDTADNTVTAALAATTGYDGTPSDSAGWTLNVPSTATSSAIKLTLATTTAAKAAIAALTATSYGYVTVVDSNKKIFGANALAAIKYTPVFSFGSTSTSATVTVSHAALGTSSNTFTITPATASGTVIGQGTGRTVTVTGVLANTAGTNTITAVPAGPINATAKGTITLRAQLKNRFGVAISGAAVTASVAGRNTVASTNLVTDADGYVAFTYTDAGTTNTNDTVTFSNATSGSISDAVTVTYSTTAVGTVTISGGNYSAGVLLQTAQTKDISAADGAEGGAVSITATVKDANGALLVGVPVKFGVTGSGVAITSTTANGYTDGTGVATASIYGWTAGTYTYTATAGSVTSTGTITFGQTAAGEERTISVSYNGNGIVTAKAVDRFGNAVPGVTIYGTGTSGLVINGKTKDSGTTGTDGTLDFVVSGTGTFSASTISWSAASGTYGSGQTSAPKGYSANSTSAATLATYAFTAYTAGTVTTDEEGVGASFDAAGVATATVDVTTTGSSDAVDAANDAVEAANAATDAANAAAEAADAATAAAQDAQAAVADLAAQVATLISGIKAQITRLTNLVIKIQKKVRA